MALAILLVAVPSVNAQKYGLELKLDHFWIYSVTPVETEANVSLKGQFDKDAVRVSLPSINYFANPVSKDGGEIQNPDDRLLCYKVKRAKGEAKLDKVKGLHTNNQFGPELLKTVKEVEFCVPSLMSQQEPL